MVYWIGETTYQPDPLRRYLFELCPVCSTMNWFPVVLIVALMVVLAGCAGIGGDDIDFDIDDESESTGDETDPDQQDSTDTDPNDGGSTTTVEGELQLHHIDVGQADATLIITPEDSVS